jgi:hypothetical protein
MGESVLVIKNEVLRTTFELDNQEIEVDLKIQFLF